MKDLKAAAGRPWLPLGGKLSSSARLMRGCFAFYHITERGCAAKFLFTKSVIILDFMKIMCYTDFIRKISAAEESLSSLHHTKHRTEGGYYYD